MHRRLCGLWKKYVNKRVVKVALLGCHSAAITTQYLKYCLTIVTLLDCKSGTMRAIWVSLMVGKGGFDAGKTIKTAFWFSRIDFHFVTGFYLLYDICMADIKTFFDKNTLACDIQSAAPTKTKQYKSISEYSLYLCSWKQNKTLHIRSWRRYYSYTDSSPRAAVRWRGPWKRRLRGRL